MRIALAAICTLATWVSQDVMAKAIAFPDPQPSPSEENPNFIVPDPVKDVALSPPETIEESLVTNLPNLQDVPTFQSNAALLEGTQQVVKDTVLEETQQADSAPTYLISQTETLCAYAPDSPTSESPTLTAQQPTTPGARCPQPTEVPDIELPIPYEFESSPALSIYIPVGYGADKNTVFLSGTYQADTRDNYNNGEDRDDDGAVGVGVGIGDAAKAVGLELSYATASFQDETFDGGLNAKVHRQFPNDISVAIGWNGFLNTGRNDFEQSLYGVATKVFRTRTNVNSPFSRVAVTAGVGSNMFRSEGAIDSDDNGASVFGNVAVRVVRPLSAIAEWTGSDLGLGLSIAPLRHVAWTITPAVRDVLGTGEGARFVLGTGVSFQF